jgi:putative photosynthetic complex assembly protein 2
MNDRVLAALFVLAIWWLSTGVVLWMVWLGRATFRFSVGVFSVLALAGLGGLFWSSRLQSTGAAYVGFGSALAIWGWHELTFLLGLVTGPRKTPCPPEALGWRRFAHGTAVVIHHELALALTMLAIVVLTWGQPNQVGTWTFLVLWVMRLSAKLNVFLGVRNLTEQFVPTHLRYMLSYFRRARMNALMPFSILAASIVVARLAGVALAADATPFVLVGHTLVGTILALAVVEHVFLTIPVPDAVLWRWFIRTKSVPDLGVEAL